jgi:hypothetical protein
LPHLSPDPSGHDSVLPMLTLPNRNRFLLKYATRDEVELLGRGSGGIVEIRNNIAHYQEKSPLYGFLRYRRRNVLIKYLPEDCSRLIQGESALSCSDPCPLARHRSSYNLPPQRG